jgi:hypothetical protein
MCQNSTTCFCHLLKSSIQNNDKTLINFFNQSATMDHYWFLKAAYALLDTGNELFNTNLTNLISEFIKVDSKQEINLADQVRKSFLRLADSVLEGEEGSEPELRDSLLKIVKYIEKLSYQNLFSLDGFDTYIELNKPAETLNTIKPLQTAAETKSCCCTLF